MKNTKLKKDVTCLTMNARERKRFKSLSGIKPQTLAFCTSMLYFWATSTENSRERKAVSRIICDKFYTLLGSAMLKAP